MADSRRWVGLIFISLAVSLIIVDSTILSVAMPSIIDHFDASSTQVQWLQEIYTLVFASLLLFFGTTADRFGRRKLALIGLTIFCVASLGASIAPAVEFLIAARVVQGLGCSMVLPSTLSLVNSTFRGTERGIAFAVWGSTICGMAAIGPVLGGWLVTDHNWQWVFGINIPIGLITILGILATVEESRDLHHRTLDFLGALMSTAGCATMVFALIEGRTYGWWNTKKPFEIGSMTCQHSVSPIPVLMVISVIIMILFIFRSRRLSRLNQNPLIELSLFSYPSFRNGNVVAMIVSLGEFGVILSLPIWMQFALGYSALKSGLILMSMAIGSFLASGIAASSSAKIPATITVRIGLLFELTSLGILAWTVSTNPAVWEIVLPLVFYGVGVGLTTAQLTGVILVDVPVNYSGQASGIQSTSRQLGAAFGIAILGTIFFTVTSRKLTSSLLDATDLPGETRDGIVSAVTDSAGSAIQGLADSAQTAGIAQLAREALTTGTKGVALGATLFLIIGLIASFSLRSKPADDGAPTCAENTSTQAED